MVLHGFGNNKDSANSINPCNLLTRMGYVTLRFDFRGCGQSEGEAGMVIPLEQVEDTQAALSYMATRADVDPERIGVVGSSFGGAVAIYRRGRSTDDGLSRRARPEPRDQSHRHGRAARPCGRSAAPEYGLADHRSGH